MSDYFDIRERLRERYIVKRPAPQGVPLQDGFLTEVAGRIILTAPARTVSVADELPRELAERWEKAASGNPHMMWLQGRFVEAEKANRNGAFWSTDDLQFGEMSVKHGPLNWLHEEQTIVGTIADNALIHPQPALAEAAKMPSGANAPYKIVKEGTKFCVYNNAGLCKATFDTHAKALDYMQALYANVPGAQKRAGKVQWTGKMKDRSKAEYDVQRDLYVMDDGTEITAEVAANLFAAQPRPFMAAVSAVWKWVHPEKARAIEVAADQGSLYYSMECIAREMSCQGDETRQGCGQTFDYITAMTQPAKVCEHIRDRSSARRMVDPSFLGGAVIVPPTQPGWGNANVEVMRQAAQLAEQTEAAMANDMTAAQWEAVMAQVLKFAAT